jgi:predicted ferric reductase
MKAGLALVTAVLVGAAAGIVFFAPIASSLFPDADGHGAWYASRASGIAAYLCLWLGLAGGLTMSSGWFDGIVNRGRLLAIHQTFGVAGVALGLAHALVLIPDEWTRFTAIDLFVPFASYYKPQLSAAGTIALYLTAIVTVSFWFRGLIGMRTWRLIHYTSFLAYVTGLWHGVQLGTDSTSPWLLAIYLGSSMVTIMALVIRLTYARPVRTQLRAVPHA